MSPRDESHVHLYEWDVKKNLCDCVYGLRTIYYFSSIFFTSLPHQIIYGSVL